MNVDVLSPKTDIRVSLLEVAPEKVMAKFAEAVTGAESEQVPIICTRTDIDRLGSEFEQWLLVSREHLVVIDARENRILHSLPINSAAEYRCQSVVGSGLLQAQLDGIFVDLLRFSNTLADKFHHIANKLHRSLHGHTLAIEPEDETDARRCSNCGLMLSFPGDVCPRCVNRGAVLGRMSKLLWGYRWLALLVMGLLIAGIALDLVVPQLTRYMVDSILPGNAEDADRVATSEDLMQTAFRSLLIIVAILAGTQIFRAAINMVNGRLGNWIGTTITFDIRHKLVSHLQKLSVSYYDQQQVGSLVGRVAYDTESLHGFVSQLTGGFLFQLIMVAGVGVMMFSINAKLAFFTLIPAPFVIFGSVLFWKYIYPRYYRFWEASSKQAGTLTGTLSGIRVVKAFNQEDREVDRFDTVSGHLRDTRRNVDRATLTFNPIMALLFQFGGWIVWYVGGLDVIGAHMSLGSLIAYLSYLAMFYGPLTTLSQFTNWLTQFSTQAHRIFEILDTPVEIAESKHPVHIDDFAGTIEFKDVTFGYSRNSPVLTNVNLKVDFGEMVGVVGRSGSGKTTIVNLISRFYDVNDGQVLIDGIDVRVLPKDDLRRLVGVVLQEPFLFRGSIWHNLVYGKPEATVEEVISAARAANTHNFIMDKPQAYDTWVGESGAGLSGGERQRIGIARVLLTNPKILILDEATSSVDPESEASIQAALAEVVKGRTTIAIAHRLSTLRNADRIMAVDNGTIAEAGSHEELLAKDGIYARLVRIQGQMTTPSVERLSVETDDGDESMPYLPTSSLPHPKGHRPRWLDPENTQIVQDETGRMDIEITDDGHYRSVFALRCLPVHYPNGFISLRFLTAKKRVIEVGLIRDLSEWSEEARDFVGQSLTKRYLVHLVTGVRAITSYTSYLEFDLVTENGPKKIMLRWQTDRAHDYGENGKMLIDTEENRYLIPDTDKLPERDRSLFQRYIYW